MSRGLGTRQRAVLAALRTMEREHGPGWRTPAEVVATVEAMSKPAPVAPVEPVDPWERIEAGQLEQCRRMVALGYREYLAALQRFEANAAEWEARRAARRQEVEAARRRKQASRYPNQRRPTPRGGEEANPSRTFALLERRGLVERIARRGPGQACGWQGGRLDFNQRVQAARISSPARAPARGSGH